MSIFTTHTNIIYTPMQRKNYFNNYLNTIYAERKLSFITTVNTLTRKEVRILNKNIKLFYNLQLTLLRCGMTEFDDSNWFLYRYEDLKKNYGLVPLNHLHYNKEVVLNISLNNELYRRTVLWSKIISKYQQELLTLSNIIEQVVKYYNTNFDLNNTERFVENINRDLKITDICIYSIEILNALEKELIHISDISDINSNKNHVSYPKVIQGNKEIILTDSYIDELKTYKNNIDYK